MRTFVLSLGALALGLVSAHEYPECEADNCYRNLIDQRFADEAEAFCPEFLSEVIEDPDAIPGSFSECNGDVDAVSSACSCITYQPTASVTATVPAEPTTTASEPEETEEPDTTSEEPTAEPTDSDVPDPEPTTGPTKTGKWTTSTVTATSTKTITDCEPTVTECPGRTTVETTVYTTVCPVTDEPAEPEPTDEPAPEPSTSLGTVTLPTTTAPGPNPTAPIVPGAAGRAGVEGLAVVAGLVAAALL